MIVVSYSCSKDSACFKGSGDTVIEVRAVEQFDKIKLSHQINLYITQDSAYSLELRGGENLLTRINTVVEDGTLSIESENKCSFLRDYDNFIDVYITVPNLTRIDYIGHGDIKGLSTLNFPDFTISSDKGTGKIELDLNSNTVNFQQHTGPADFIITGNTTYNYLYTNGNGFVHLENLNSKFAHVSCNGTGDVHVHVTDELRVELRYIGSVYYYGNPILNVTEHTGTGQIIKK